MREAVSLVELRQIALAKVREHRGCHDVQDLSVCPIENGGPDRNWAISCGIGGSDRVAASKAALYVEEQMRGSYELRLDSLDGASEPLG